MNVTVWVWSISLLQHCLALCGPHPPAVSALYVSFHDSSLLKRSLGELLRLFCPIVYDLSLGQNVWSNPATNVWSGGHTQHTQHTHVQKGIQVEAHKHIHASTHGKHAITTHTYAERHTCRGTQTYTQAHAEYTRKTHKHNSHICRNIVHMHNI